MKVKFLKDYGGFEVGEVIWMPDAKEAESLAKSGILELIEPEPGEPEHKKNK